MSAASSSPFSPDRLLGASLWRMTFLLVQGGGSVVLAATLGHILGARAFATTLLVQGVLVIAQAIGDFGLAQATVTVLPAWIARAPGLSAKLIRSATHAYFYAAVAALLLTLISAVFVPDAAVVPILVSAPAAAATVIVAGADGLLRSQGEFRRPVIYVAASEVGGFAGIPVALATHSAVWTCVAISAGTVIGATGALLSLLARLRGDRPADPGVTREDQRELGTVREFLKAAVPLGLAQVFVVLGARFNTLIAASLTGVVAAGTFEGVWRIYQLGQYAAGALATAAAPFIASALGANQAERALALLRQLLLRLLAVGVLAGLALYLGRWPLAHVFAGSLAAPVADGLVFLAVVTPIAAVGVPAFYTLIALDDERRLVLACFAVGAAVNLTLALVLARPLHAHGVLLACAAGTTITSLLLLSRLGVVIRSLRRSRDAAAVR
jgi:O-antigen/teichoic acid export membrane protein